MRSAYRPVRAPLRRGDGADGAGPGAGVLGRPQRAAGCVSGVRSLAGGYPDRGARILAAAGGGAGHQAGRECRQRRLGPGDAALRVHSGALGGHHHLRRQHRCAHRPPGNLRATCRNSAAACPTGVGVPKLSPLVSSTMDLLKIGLVSDKVDAYALRDAADWVIKPRLLAVPGVAHVIVFGGNVRQIQIQPDMQPADELRHHAHRRGRCRPGRAAAARRRASSTLANQRVLMQSPIPAARHGHARPRRWSPCATASRSGSVTSPR